MTIPVPGSVGWLLLCLLIGTMNTVAYYLGRRAGRRQASRPPEGVYPWVGGRQPVGGFGPHGHQLPPPPGAGRVPPPPPAGAVPPAGGWSPPPPSGPPVR